MSGGSLNYAFSRLEDTAGDIRRHAETPLHHAFADHLIKVAKALHDIEWLFSGDYGEGQEVEAIKAVLPADAEIVSAIGRAEATSSDLLRLLAEAKAHVDRMSPEQKEAMYEAQRQSYARSLKPCPHGKIDFEQCAECRKEYATGGFVAPARTTGVKVELNRREGLEPVPSHGGPALSVTWELSVNGVVISRENDRYRWDCDPAKRAKTGAEPPSGMKSLFDELVGTISQKGVDHA